MEPLKLTRDEYAEGIEVMAKMAAADPDKTYLDLFTFEFPEGLNTANVMEVCRAVGNETLEGKARLARVCIEGKPVKVTCPNGEVKSFVLSHADDGIDGIDLFRDEPLAFWSLADAVFGRVLKKSVRLPAARAEAKEQTSGA